MQVGLKVTEDEYKTHVANITAEMENTKPYAVHIKMLLSESFANRRAHIASLKPEEWGCLLDTFPCFNEIDYVRTHVWNFIRNVFGNCECIDLCTI